MGSLEEKILRFSNLAQSIEQNIGKNNLGQAEEKLIEYTGEVNNSAKYCYKAILLFQSGNIENAIEELKLGSQAHPFSFNIYYNLGFIYNTIGESDKALESFFKAVKYSLTEENKDLSVKEAQNIIKRSQSLKISEAKINNVKKMLSQADARIYPLSEDKESIIRKPQNMNTENEYMVNMYKNLSIANVDLNSRMYFKSELIKGKISRSKKLFYTKGPVVIPISKINNSSKIEIKVNGEKHKFEKNRLPINQFHYIRISESGEIEITSNSEIFIGDIIELEPEIKSEKLVLKIFIDGLSYQFLEDNGLAQLMPNTYQFFEQGFMAKNCYTVSEWTLPSKSSINTGVYATQHGMLQPEHLLTFQDSTKLLAEYFQEQGYYCTNISTNWRTTPALGYYKGFNRMIYQNFLGGMDAKDVIMEAIEHLMSFDKINNFMTISLMDLHNAPDEIETHLFSQVNTDINDKIYKNKIGTTSVQTKYDSSKIAKYREEIRRVDSLLSVLYAHILRNYAEDEFLITLHSDHGQSFLDEDINLLSDNRLKIPFMMRGRNIPVVENEELIQSVDILPSILKSCGFEPAIEIDGQFPKALGGKGERDFTFTQIIHPNQTYKVVIHEKEISYYLETKHLVLADLTICLEDYQSRIVNRATGEDITGDSLDKKVYYDEFVFQQIKDMLRWTN